MDDLVKYIESLSSAYKSTQEELLKQGLIISELRCQVDSMEKSVKDTNKKITMIRNQLRKEKGRGEL
jgi:septation ring formation regulator EzrA